MRFTILHKYDKIMSLENSKNYLARAELVIIYVQCIRASNLLVLYANNFALGGFSI